MNSPTDIARSLSEAQRAFLRNLGKHPKPWNRALRHAKIRDYRAIRGLWPKKLLDHNECGQARLTPLGLAVRAAIIAEDGEQ